MKLPWRRLSWAVPFLVPTVFIVALVVLPGYYFRAKGITIARKYEPLVQAICNFRAETGLLPYELDDLRSRYKVAIPQRVHWSPAGVLDVQSVPRVSYIFGDDFKGWSSHWGRLSLPPVRPRVDPVPRNALIAAALNEYDRRIEHHDDNRWHLSAKMALLASLDRRNDVYRACVEALQEHPDWWRANFGVAAYAPQELQPAAEAKLRQWVERTPGFIHFWYLAKYYRDLDRHADAFAALADAAKYPLEQVDDDAGSVPHWFAFDAAAYACRHQQPELALAICEAWSHPRGVYDYQSPDMPAFRAAALLQLGRFDEARAAFARVKAESETHAIWAGNLERLGNAISARDSSFVYDPGAPHAGFWEWSPLPEPELR